MKQIGTELLVIVLLVLVNGLLEQWGPERIGAALLRGTILQPLLASLIGLVPNGLVSVLLAELYAKGSLSFGARVAGLCAGRGLGIPGPNCSGDPEEARHRCFTSVSLQAHGQCRFHSAD